MASRKKANVVPTVEPTIEQPPEQPIIANAAPTLPVPALNVTPVRVERPAARPSSNVRAPSKGNKGGAKVGIGKGSTNIGSSSSHYQGTSTSKPKRKKAKKGLMVKGNFLGDRKNRPSKKKAKRGLLKRGLSKKRY